jgi:vesicle coat complex subunit
LFSPLYKDFFARFTDPVYVKKLKLEILVRIADDANVSAIMAELSAYVADISPDTARSSIKAMGKIAQTVPACAADAGAP